MRRLPQQYANAYVRRERDPRVLRRQARLLAACLVLAVGFVVAVRQQIEAVEYGYKTEALRREREQLLDEQRRLLFALEEHSSPANLERAAREMNLELQPARSAQIDAGARERETRGEAPPQRRAVVGAGVGGAVLRR
jgi:hypothetical protein